MRLETTSERVLAVIAHCQIYGPITSEIVGELMGKWGPEAVNELKRKKNILVRVVGYAPKVEGQRTYGKRKLYMIRGIE